jgi:type I restriction enzyme S subunit
MMSKIRQVPESYMKTELGTIPEDWNVVKLESILRLLRNGFNVKQKNYGKNPVSRIETISNEFIDFNRVKYIDDIDQTSLNEYKLIKGDILFSHINSEKHIGKTAIYLNDDKILIHGINLLLFRTNEKIFPLYLLNLLKQLKNEGLFIKIAKRAVNQASISTTQLKKIRISLPSLPEQQKIASILSKVDEQIEQTVQVIEKTELLKKGLMQKLFTKGIGHTKFKKTELGEIPEEWDIIKFSKIFKNGPQNGLYKHKSHYGKGHKIVELKDLYKSNFFLDTGDLSLIDLTDKEKANYKLLENDVLIN